MLVLDTSAQQNWQMAAKAETSAASRQKQLAQDILSNSITVEDESGRDVSNLLAQLGRPLTSADVQARLKLINPQLIFERSIQFPELTAIYFYKDERTPSGGWTKRKIHLCGMESGIMPEFSVRHKTKKRIANPELFGNKTPTREIDWTQVDTFAGETRGWRTVLIRLLHLGLIKRMDVEKHFGWSPSMDSKRWSEETR